MARGTKREPDGKTNADDLEANLRALGIDPETVNYEQRIIDALKKLCVRLKRPPNAREVGIEIDSPASSVRRLMETMERRGFLIRIPRKHPTWGTFIPRVVPR